MANASMKDIKARIKSVSGTMQITKAMELVATSKLRRAKERAEASKPYLCAVTDAMRHVLSTSDARKSVWAMPHDGKRLLLIVIAGDRGLAGGYNSNIFRLAASLACGYELTVLPVGHRAVEYYKHRNVPLFTEKFSTVATLGVGDCFSIATLCTQTFAEKQFDRVAVVYTKFASMMTQIPSSYELLPLPLPAEGKEEPLYESEDIDELLLTLSTDYIGGVLSGTVAESLASESGARRAAMNAANKNAEEMLDGLTLHYNQARQAVITQEITEIVSGAEAL